MHFKLQATILFCSVSILTNILVNCYKIISLFAEMKLILLLTTFFGVSTAVLPDSLQRDINELENLISNSHPAPAQLKIPQLQFMVSYLQSPQWARLVSTIESKPAVKQLYKEMLKGGVDLHEILKSVGTNPQKTVAVSHAVGKFFDKARRAYPQPKLEALLKENLLSNPKGRKFYNEVSNKRTGRLVGLVSWIPAVIKLSKILIKLGIKIVQIMPIIYKIFQW